MGKGGGESRQWCGVFAQQTKFLFFLFAIWDTYLKLVRTICIKVFLKPISNGKNSRARERSLWR